MENQWNDGLGRIAEKIEAAEAADAQGWVEISQIIADCKRQVAAIVAEVK